MGRRPTRRGAARPMRRRIASMPWRRDRSHGGRDAAESEDNSRDRRCTARSAWTSLAEVRGGRGVGAQSVAYRDSGRGSRCIGTVSAWCDRIVPDVRHTVTAEVAATVSPREQGCRHVRHHAHLLQPSPRSRLAVPPHAPCVTHLCSCVGSDASGHRPRRPSVVHRCHTAVRWARGGSPPRPTRVRRPPR